MPINMQVLEQALAPLEEVGSGELTFPVGNTDITLRLLLPEEEIEAQRFAVQIFEEGGTDEDRHSMLSYMDRMKIGVLSHSVIAVGQLDLRDDETVETGEVLPNDKPVTVLRFVAVRDLIRKWGRPLLVKVFQKYVELVSLVEKKAEEAILFEPSDLPTEIERLEKRLGELRAELEEKKADRTQTFNDELRAMAEVDQTELLQEPPEEEEELQEPPAEPPPGMAPTPATRARSQHQEEVAEARARQQEELAQARAQQQEQIAQARGRQRGDVLPQTMAPPEDIPVQQGRGQSPQSEDPLPQPNFDSFVDPSDTDAMGAAAAAETQRLLARRRRAAQAQAQEEERRAMGQPPHAAAIPVAREFVEEEQALVAQSTRVVQQGTVDGVEAYRLGNPADLTTKQPTGTQRVVVNQGPDVADARNPRFRRPARRP